MVKATQFCCDWFDHAKKLREIQIGIWQLLYHRINEHWNSRKNLQKYFSENFNSDCGFRESTKIKTTFNPPLELDRTRKYEMTLVNLETYYSFPNLSDENNVFRYSSGFIEVGRGDEDDSTWQRQWVEVQIPEGSYDLIDIAETIKIMIIVDLTFRITTCRSLLAIAFRTWDLVCINLSFASRDFVCPRMTSIRIAWFVFVHRRGHHAFKKSRVVYR